MAEKHTHRSVEYNIKPKNKPTYSQSINLPQKEAKIYKGEMTVFSISGAGKTGQLHVQE